MFRFSFSKRHMFSSARYSLLLVAHPVGRGDRRGHVDYEAAWRGLALAAYTTHCRALRLLFQPRQGSRTVTRAGTLLVGDGIGVRTTLQGGRAVVQFPSRCTCGISNGPAVYTFLVGVGSWHHEPARSGGQVHVLRALHRLA